MADERILTTRIVLRNDYLSAWENSTKVLLSGEVALAKRDDGLFEVRVGDGTKTWPELSGTEFGHTGFYTADTIEELSAITPVNGSIGIVGTVISGDITAKTAYVYNSADKQWKALAGNYSTDNVYFTNDISLFGDYSAVGNIKLSSATFATKGKTVKEAFNDIFDKTIQPALGSEPFASFRFDIAGCYEVGEVLTPTYYVDFSQGKYIKPWDGTFTYDGTNASSWVVTNGTETKTSESGTFTELSVTDGTDYGLSATVNYSAGSIAKDNKGNPSDPTIQRQGGTTAKITTDRVTGFRYIYIGSLTSTSDVTEETVKGLEGKFKSSEISEEGTSITVKSSGGDVTLVSGAKRIVVAIPTENYAKTIAKVMLDTASADITSTYKYLTQIQISGKVAGENMLAYDIYVYQPASIDSAEAHTITLK